MKKVDYIRIYQPDHEHANVDGRILEHILIAERALDHALPKGACVHHIDRDGTNNKNNNLVICQNRAYHLLLHVRMRAKEACGNSNYRQCKYCRNWDDPKNPVIYKKRKSPQPMHRVCFNEYARSCYKSRRERNGGGR